MEVLLGTTLPLFGLVLAGYVSGRRNWLGPQASRVLSGFVFYFALPLLLLRTLATAPGTESFDIRFVAAYAVAAVGSMGLVALLGRLVFGLGLGEGTLFGMAGAFGSTAIVPLPIALLLLGPAAVLPMAMVIMIDNAVLIPAAIAAQELSRARRSAGPGRVWPATTRAVLQNPVVVATVVGIVLAFAQVPLPAVVENFAVFGGGAAIPCALVALGITLSGIRFSEKLAETSVMVAVKLLLYPALVFGLVSLIPDLDPVWRGAALLAGAGPIGINVYLIAANYDCYVDRASTALMASTVLSLPVLSAITIWLAA